MICAICELMCDPVKSSYPRVGKGTYYGAVGALFEHRLNDAWEAYKMKRGQP